MAGPAWHGIPVNAVEGKPARDNFRAINLYLRSVSKSLAGGTETVPAEGLPGEPYVTIGNTSGLTQERALAVAAPVTFSDGGANGSVTIGASIATPSITYATAPAAGSATSLIRSDATLTFPSTLQTILNKTLVYSDDGEHVKLQGETGANENLTIAAGGDLIFSAPTATKAILFKTPTATFTISDDASNTFWRSNLGDWTIEATDTASSMILKIDRSQVALSDDATDQTLTFDLGQLNILSGNDDYAIGTTAAGIDAAGAPHVGIGVAPQGQNRLSVSVTPTATQTSATAMAFTATPAITSGSAVVAGILGTVAITGGNQPAVGIAPQVLILNISAFTEPIDAIKARWVNNVFSGAITELNLLHAAAAVTDVGARTFTDVYGVRVDDLDLSVGTITNLYGIHTKNRAVIENPASRTGAGENVLTLNQLDTTTGNTAHMLLNDKTADPATPVDGMIWRNASALNMQTSAGGTTNLITAVINKTGAYTAIDSDRVITCDASGGAFTITLPAASGRTGRIYHIKKTDSSANGVTVDGNASETIDGSTTVILSSQHDSIMIVSDGSNWHII